MSRDLGWCGSWSKRVGVFTVGDVPNERREWSQVESQDIVSVSSFRPPTNTKRCNNIVGGAVGQGCQTAVSWHTFETGSLGVVREFQLWVGAFPAGGRRDGAHRHQEGRRIGVIKPCQFPFSSPSDQKPKHDWSTVDGTCIVFGAVRSAPFDRLPGISGERSNAKQIRGVTYT